MDFFTIFSTFTETWLLAVPTSIWLKQRITIFYLIFENQVSPLSLNTNFLKIPMLNLNDLEWGSYWHIFVPKSHFSFSCELSWLVWNFCTLELIILKLFDHSNGIIFVSIQHCFPTVRPWWQLISFAYRIHMCVWYCMHPKQSILPKNGSKIFGEREISFHFKKPREDD